VADFTCELYRLLGIKVAASTAYHLQTDSQTERVNQELEQYLCLFTSQRQDDWDELLLMAKFTVHSLRQQTLFMLNTGRNPCMGFEHHQPPLHSESVNEFKDGMAKGLEEAKAALAKAALAKAQSNYKLHYNCQREPAPDLKPGDKVWLDASDICTTSPSVKLSHLF
jgi:hypothetical protein